MNRFTCASLALVVATTAGACMRELPRPPANPRTVTFRQRYLPAKPAGVTGDPQPIVDGTWCASDGAFSLPVVPFPDGPTEFSGNYYDHGVTSTLYMLDKHESVVHIARTQIREDLKENEVLPRVADKLSGTRMVVPTMTLEWIRQNGRTEIQTVNPSEGYDGRDDLMFLSLSHGYSNIPGNCRVDRHFTGAGYYFQVVAVVHQPQEKGAPKYERDSCAFALELAAWTSQNIRIGQGCGESRSSASARAGGVNSE